MRATGTSRLVVVSAAPVASDDHGITVGYRLLAGLLLRTLLRGLYADLAIMEDTIIAAASTGRSCARRGSPADPGPGPTARPRTATCAAAPASQGPTWPRRSWPP
jgi:hypothetical protein